MPRVLIRVMRTRLCTTRAAENPSAAGALLTWTSPSTTFGETVISPSFVEGAFLFCASSSPREGAPGVTTIFPTHTHV